jgi:hypothetical protein
VLDAVVSKVALEVSSNVLAALVGVKLVYMTTACVGCKELMEYIWHLVLGADEHRHVHSIHL